MFSNERYYFNCESTCTCIRDRRQQRWGSYPENMSILKTWMLIFVEADGVSRLKWLVLNKHVACVVYQWTPSIPARRALSCSQKIRADVVLMLGHRLWRWPSIKTASVKCPVLTGRFHVARLSMLVLLGLAWDEEKKYNPANTTLNTKRSHNAGLKLGQRRRWWFNIKPAMCAGNPLSQRLGLVGVPNSGLWTIPLPAWYLNIVNSKAGRSSPGAWRYSIQPQHGLLYIPIRIRKRMAIISYYIRNRGYAAYNAYHTMVYEFFCNDGVTLYYNTSKITILDIAKAIRQTRIYVWVMTCVQARDRCS